VRTYDQSKPLIFIHIPKAAGTSTREVFKTWFGAGFHPHYIDESTGSLPPHIPLRAVFPWKNRRPICIYGHFNRLRGIGIATYYPQVRQFVTIVRDPFEQTVSEYFYLRRVAADWADRNRRPTLDLRSFLQTASPNLLNQFPRPLSLANYRSTLDREFIHIGIAENASVSMAIIAEKLGKPALPIPTLNITPRDQEVPYDLKPAFIARHSLEYAIYDLAVATHDRR
jgi:hypothetical protein